MDDYSAKEKIKNGKPGFKASHAPPILMFIEKLEGICMDKHQNWSCM